MTRRLSVRWPDSRPFAARDGRPIRILAASDEPDHALEFASNREGLGAIDAIVGAGDLEPHWLGFLGDAFGVPVSYVVGNHDRGGTWTAKTAASAPTPLPAATVSSVAGLPVAALPWPGRGDFGNVRDDRGAWLQSLAVARRRVRAWREPLVILSHVPPAGAGDADDAYHVGFAGYRWLLDRLRPPLWIHGHVTTASVPTLRVDVGRSTLVNATGSVLIELHAPDG